jgi:hypothetical protein
MGGEAVARWNGGSEKECTAAASGSADAARWGKHAKEGGEAVAK